MNPPPPRYVSVLMKDPQRAPVTDAYRDVARDALTQLAEANGMMLTGGLVVTGTGYSETERLYVASYGSHAVRDPGASIAFIDSPDVCTQYPGATSTRARLMSLRAHRSPLHAMQVITSSVDHALETREPLAALVALHLLRISPTSDRTRAARTHHILGSIFGTHPAHEKADRVSTQEHPTRRPETPDLETP
ncbi:hypothetical protein ACFV42_48175 [Streptomyces solisilvae]|uniref:hypothetical protein n=1 Tax=Streptomyces malaysiensis TaxID=92644 RepID=UPI0036BD6DC6